MGEVFLKIVLKVRQSFSGHCLFLLRKVSKLGRISFYDDPDILFTKITKGHGKVLKVHLQLMREPSCCSLKDPLIPYSPTNSKLTGEYG